MKTKLKIEKKHLAFQVTETVTASRYYLATLPPEGVVCISRYTKRPVSCAVLYVLFRTADWSTG